uniref:Uncharacterized protein n=1 Tax=Araneus ventricosus TaxID=182803 RepID=A0A4Y2I899_ARAVE|nr:hypothetical protein AVEN_127644-1 [Araneus ventricosus]
MRSRRISMRVLASPGGVVMVGVELPYTDDGTYLLWEGLSRGRNVTLTPACPTKVLEPSACFSVNSVYGHPERNPPNISVSTAISAPYLTSKEANRLRPAFVAVQGKFLDLPGRLAICERVNLIQVKRAENSSETML